MVDMRNGGSHVPVWRTDDEWWIGRPDSSVVVVETGKDMRAAIRRTLDLASVRLDELSFEDPVHQFQFWQLMRDEWSGSPRHSRDASVRNR
jgi:hypothetical protein